MPWRVLVWAGVAVAAVAAVALAVFWRAEGLEEAGWLAGVLSGFATLASLAILLYEQSPSRSGRRPSEAERADGPAGAGTVNIVRDATSTGPVIMGRDISGPVTLGSPPPSPSPPSTGEAEASRAAETPGVGGEGSVSNTISSGFTQGPVIMGRDISGPVTSVSGAENENATDRPDDS